MGWTGIHATHYNNRGAVDRKAECDAYFMEGLNAGLYDVVSSSMHGSTYYAAVKHIKDYKTDMPIPEDQQTVFCAVFLTQVNSRDYYNFLYKDMDDTCGPCYYDCPKKILDLLSPTDNEWAIEWRQKCLENIRRKKEEPGLGKLPVGTKIKIKYNGKDMILVKHPVAYQFKRPFWYNPESGGYMPATRISEFEIVSA